MKETMENVVHLRAAIIDDPIHELMTEFDHVEEQEFGVKVEVQRQERAAKLEVQSLQEAIDRMKYYLDEIEMVMP